MALHQRSQEDVRRDIEREREQLVVSMTELRREATNIKAKLPKLAAGAVAAFATLKALKLVRRKRRKP
jgi:hypothetical protein